MKIKKILIILDPTFWVFKVAKQHYKVYTYIYISNFCTTFYDKKCPMKGVPDKE